MNYTAIDLFSGCGGLSEGLKQAGFNVIAALEIEPHAAKSYKLNHPNTELFQEDIRKFDIDKIKKVLKGRKLHLLAGCPPCQGFSSVRRLNREEPVEDERNNLLWEYYRMVVELEPEAIMMENVAGLKNYSEFKKMVSKLDEIGYHPQYRVENVQEFGVPQRRRRLILVGSKFGKIEIKKGTKERVTVKDIIENIESKIPKNDLLHKIYPKHTEKVKIRIELTPKNGGSRKDLPEEYILECHKKENVGFNDVYGRLKWNSVSSTITGGCLNPSKGRFLHPEENRCITAREAASLQTFPYDYIIPTDIPITKIALLIGNALPPKFSKIQSENIRQHLEEWNVG